MRNLIILGACLFSTPVALAQDCPPNGKVVLKNTGSASFALGLAAQGESAPSATTTCINQGEAQGLWPSSQTTSMTVYWTPCNATNWRSTGASSNFTTNSGYIWNCTGSGSSVSCTPGQCSPAARKVVPGATQGAPRIQQYKGK